MLQCPTDNITAIDQSNFWDPEHGINWDAHRIGWSISGGCALITLLITCYTVWQHCRNYTVPREQRQIIRILYMPPVYAIISFFSYRFFRDYTYYSLIEVAYEAITITAFLLLIIEYVAGTSTDHTTKGAMARKDKRPLPMPFCCWRYRPTKAYFMYTVKWSVLQYVIVRPLASIAGIVAEYLGVLCEARGYDPRFASVYLSIVDFISITIALYGLLLFYGLTKEELSDKRPLAKFLCIKLIVMFTFYQTFVFSMLEGRVIHETIYWSETNIANGLNALAICIEMVFFAIGMGWAYPATEYRTSRPTSIWKPLWDSINYSDFIKEIWGSLRYYVTAAKERRHQRDPIEKEEKPTFATAFGISPPVGESGSQLVPSSESAYDLQEMNHHDRPYDGRPAYGFGAPQHSYGSDSPQTAGFTFSPGPGPNATSMRHNLP
ncbi:hypothetical protein MIND_01317000 [Mycena indigotica]|uniref:DUF300-domain-containing protein n=1 Tax=Mycena indigotica TaxID=2126181 RepID=A0A8H6VQX6_9AGAR|nr:uncharacterized protein MIND_01317000 [Mycena indigotica]KAF7290762.1 hypothetical protein MIND_01317000 [Mycena indigotica]